MHVHHFNFIVLQPNSINTDTEWAIEKFCINGVPVLIKSKNHLSQSRQMPNARKHYKNRSSLYYLIKTDLCISSLMPQSSTGIYKSLYLVYCSAGNINMLSTREFFFLQEEKVCKNMPLIMNCLH